MNDFFLSEASRYIANIPRHRQRGARSTFEAPLLDTSSHGRNRQGRRRRRRPYQEIELTSRQYYDPPLRTVDSEDNRPDPNDRFDDEYLRVDSLINVESLINLPPVLNQNNPANDINGSIFAHGCLCVQCVRTQEVGIVENCGAYDQIVGPGLYCGIFWPCSSVVAWMSLRVQQIDMTCETKTKDNVFVFVDVSVLYRVVTEKAYEAHYRLKDSRLQIQTTVYDVIRSEVPCLTVDELFASKSNVSDSIFTRLQSVVKDYGYEIVETLVKRISPNELVKMSMNEIHASKLYKEAMFHRAEAEKIKIMKKAEGAAEMMYLHGVGTAKQRFAITQGAKSSIIECSSPGKQDENIEDAMNILLVSLYLDTLAAVGSNEIYINTLPGDVFQNQDLFQKHPRRLPVDLLS